MRGLEHRDSARASGSRLAASMNDRFSPSDALADLLLIPPSGTNKLCWPEGIVETMNGILLLEVGEMAEKRGFESLPSALETPPSSCISGVSRFMTLYI